MQGSVEIKPGRLAQVTQALKSGKLVVVDNDVQNVANDLHDIDPGLRLEYEPEEDVWVVKHVGLDAGGEMVERFVSSFEVCDQRIVHRMREISRPGYDFVAELDRLEREAERAREHAMSEQIGPHAEKLAFALTRDLGRHETPRTKSSYAFVPAQAPKG